MKERRPAEVFKVSEYLKDEMDTRNLSTKDLADLLKWPSSLIEDLLADNIRMSTIIATDLSTFFGTSVDYWFELDRLSQRENNVTSQNS